MTLWWAPLAVETRLLVCVLNAMPRTDRRRPIVDQMPIRKQTDLSSEYLPAPVRH